MEIISAKYLLTIDTDPLVDGAIAVENGEIIDVGREEDLLARYADAVHEDFPNHVLMPGLINAHTHLDMSLHKNFPFDPVRSVAVDVNFIDWLISCIEYKRSSRSDRLRQAVEEGLKACVESGTTCVGDMGSFEGIFQSVEQAGIRAVVFPEVLSYDPRATKDLFESALAIVEKYVDEDSDLVSVGVGPYAPYTLSRNILKIMAQYSRSSQIPIMIHASESFSEMEFFYNSTGDIATHLFPKVGWGENLPAPFKKTPIEYLDEIDFLASSPILVGCVHVSESDMERMAEWKAKVVWCPRSNHYLHLPPAPVTVMKKMGILVCLATDGLSSTNTLSLWDEMRFVIENGRDGAPVPPPRDLLKMVTLDAAHVLGLEAEIGSLSVGKKADYIVVDISRMDDKGDLYTSLINHTRDYHVHKVVVAGEVLKQAN